MFLNKLKKENKTKLEININFFSHRRNEKARGKSKNYLILIENFDNTSRQNINQVYTNLRMCL